MKDKAAENEVAETTETETEEISRPLTGTVGTIGRIVNFYHAQFVENGGLHPVPAIITRVARDDMGAEVYALTVFHWSGTYPFTDVRYSEAPHPKCWSWPTRATAQQSV